jgi:hypothetical protein
VCDEYTGKLASRVAVYSLKPLLEPLLLRFMCGTCCRRLSALNFAKQLPGVTIMCFPVTRQAGDAP